MILQTIESKMSEVDGTLVVHGHCDLKHSQENVMSSCFLPLDEKAGQDDLRSHGQGCIAKEEKVPSLLCVRAGS
jgi:hypothetical protein